MDTTLLPQPPAITPPGDDTPSVTALRETLKPYREKNNALALALLAGDILLLAIGQWLVLAMGTRVGLGLGALVTWVAIVRLFVIGHDACHGALTSSERLNRILGRIAFLPSLTPFSLWRVGHNVVHHGFNNLRGRDFVWEPMNPQEYAAKPAWRRGLERIYRGALGPALYYFVEIWWKRLYFPAKDYIATRRAQFLADSVLVSAVGALWIVALVVAARTIGAPATAIVVCGFVVPFILWNWTVGLIVYLHHTHPDLRWFDDRREWLAVSAQLNSTVHLIMPWPIGPLMHHIMEHPAHHLDAFIPLYHLKAAQRRLQALGLVATSTRFTLRHYLSCLRQCKVYDYARRCWAPFPSVQPATA
jgi:omega-6 fatty acid desaturase (delta-12 desaturase)